MADKASSEKRDVRALRHIVDELVRQIVHLFDTEDELAPKGNFLTAKQLFVIGKRVAERVTGNFGNTQVGVVLNGTTITPELLGNLDYGFASRTFHDITSGPLRNPSRSFSAQNRYNAYLILCAEVVWKLRQNGYTDEIVQSLSDVIRSLRKDLATWKQEDADADGYVNLGEVCRTELGMQAQYGTRYAHGRLEGSPGLGFGLRFRDLDKDYHDIKIHVEDIVEFVRRVRIRRNV